LAIAIDYYLANIGLEAQVLRYLLKSMRPRQWVKNLFVFAGLVFDEKFFVLPLLGKTVLTFILFSMVSSAVYLLNDIVDIEHDRKHPEKRFRPIASGKLRLREAIIAAILLLAIALPIAFRLNLGLGLVTGGYLLLMLVYSFVLKHMVIVDVLTIAGGFVLRVWAGTIVVSVTRFSPWLFVCTVLLSLFLGISKRRHEVVLLSEEAVNHRQILDEYSPKLLDEMIDIVASATVIAYSLYTFSAENLPKNHAMMLTIPFVLYGIFRYLYLIHQKNLGGSPEQALLQDRPLLIDIGLWVIIAAAILYIF